MDITEAQTLATRAVVKADLRVVINTPSSLDIENVKGICRAALVEIERLESPLRPVLPRYAGLVVDLLNREDGSVKRVMLYPATRVELQQWTGGGWETQETWDCHGEGAPGGIDPVKWVGAPYTK
jgi:hypothetical protein